MPSTQLPVHYQRLTDEPPRGRLSTPPCSRGSQGRARCLPVRPARQRAFRQAPSDAHAAAITQVEKQSREHSTSAFVFQKKKTPFSMLKCDKTGRAPALSNRVAFYFQKLSRRCTPGLQVPLFCPADKHATSALLKTLPPLPSDKNTK